MWPDNGITSQLMDTYKQGTLFNVGPFYATYGTDITNNDLFNGKGNNSIGLKIIYQIEENII